PHPRRVPAGGRGAGAPRPRGPVDHRQTAAHSVRPGFIPMKKPAAALLGLAFVAGPLSAQVVMSLEAGVAKSRQATELPGSWSGLFRYERPWHAKAWGVELGYASMGSTSGPVIPGLNPTAGSSSQSAWHVGAIVAKPLNESRARPTVAVGLQFYL